MRRCLLLLVALALTITACGGGSHPRTTPKVSLAKLKTILLTAGELPVPAFTARIGPGSDRGTERTASARYVRSGDRSQLTITLDELVYNSDAKDKLAASRSAATRVPGASTARLPFGTNALVISSTGPSTTVPSTTVTLVQGATVITVSLVGVATPALTQNTIVEIARRQNYKYIASAK